MKISNKSNFKNTSFGVEIKCFKGILYWNYAIFKILRIDYKTMMRLKKNIYPYLIPMKILVIL